MLAFAVILLQFGTWTSIPNMPNPRQELGVAAVEGRIYAVGGLAPNGAGSNIVDIFDTRTNQWRAGPPLPIAIHHPMVAAVDSKVYLAGGYADSGAVANTFELDTDSLTWTRKADMPTPRGAGTAVGLNGRLYVIGGERGESVGDCAVYDPSRNSWNVLAPMPTPRNHLGAAAARGRIYVVGGRPGNLAVNEAYDPLADKWITRTPMPTGRSGIAAAAIGNFVFAFGGEGNSASPTGIFPQHEAYDADLDSWTMLEAMPVGRHGIGAGVIGNRIFIPGGAPVEGFGTTAQSDFFAVNEELILPQFVVGSGYSTQIVITNPDESRAAEVTVSITDLSGAPLLTNLNEIPPDAAQRSTITLTIPPLASRIVLASEVSTSAPLKVGTTRIRSNVRVAGYATMQGVGPPNTVYPVVPARNVIFPVFRVQMNGRSTGIAIVNTSGRPATVMMSFIDTTGREALLLERAFAAGEQLSRFVHELFPSLQSADFVGSLTIRSTGQLAVVALAFDPAGVTTIPVTPLN